MTEDNVNNPGHYNRNGIEVIDVIETYTPNSPHLANVLKYVCRHSYKGKPLEDLKKARWYLDRKIKLMEREAELQEVLEHARPWEEVKKELEEEEAANATYLSLEDYASECEEPDPTGLIARGYNEEKDPELFEQVRREMAVQPSPSRIGGETPAASDIKNEYYTFDPDEALQACSRRSCKETIKSSDTPIIRYGRQYCSYSCAIWDK